MSAAALTSAIAPPAAPVWIARGKRKANKSHALAACRADLSAKQASAQIGVTLAAKRIEQHEAGDILGDIFAWLAGQRAVAPAPRPTYRGGCSCGPRARPPASVGKPVLTSTCALWGLLWGLLGASSLARHAGVLGHRAPYKIQHSGHSAIVDPRIV